MDTYLAIQILGFATGSLLFVLLFALLWKTRRLAGDVKYGLWIAGLSGVWNLASLVNHLLQLVGVGQPSLAYGLSSALAYSALAILPTVFFLDYQPIRWTAWWQSQATGWFCFLSFGLAGVLSAGFFLAALVENFPVSFFTLLRFAAYNLGLHIVVGSILFYGGSRHPLIHSGYVRTITLLGIALTLGLMVIVHSVVGYKWARTLSIFTQQSSIPGALISFVFLARFRFADVFVKRCLTLLTAAFLALLSTLWLMEPLGTLVQTSVAYPKAGAWVVSMFVLAGLLLLFPKVDQLLGTAADRWLFRRPDYQEILRRFPEAAHSLTSAEEVLAVAETTIRTALGIPDLRVAPAEDTPEVKSADDVVVPIRTDTKPHFITIASGKHRRNLLSDEFAFLESMAERIGRKLDALHAESERAVQKIHEAHLQHLLTQANLKALRAQINPHFLFNTLNTITDLISSEPEKAERMTERLAEVFRYVLAQTNRTIVPLGEEFEFLRTYLEIEQERFGNRLQVTMELDPALAHQEIPSLLLQPLVENAVKHGLSSKLDGGTIRISARDQGDALHLDVEDTGGGWRQESPAGHLRNGGGVGLQNVAERLETLYGNRAQFTTCSTPGEFTRVSIVIPKRNDA